MTDLTNDPLQKPRQPKVHVLPFIVALVLAPLVIGLPAWGLVWLGTLANEPLVPLMVLSGIPAFATVMGAPTFLLFGAPALWLAIRKGGSLPGSAFFANLVSLPFVACVIWITDGNVGSAVLLFALFGSLFAPLWASVFAGLYARFGGEMVA